MRTMRTRKTIQVEEFTCDVCGESIYPQRCMNCGGDYCSEHSKEYPHSMHFTGSMDGRFCYKCIEALLNVPSQLFSKYQQMEALRQEREACVARWNKRGNALEEEIKALHAAWEADHKTPGTY